MGRGSLLPALRCRWCAPDEGPRWEAQRSVPLASRIPLKFWCRAFWGACASKKGISALQISRETGLSYKSALFLMHRIRYAMADAPGTARPLSGTVEVDETYVGGKPRNPRPRREGWNKDNKACVVGMVERGGEIRPVHITDVNGSTLRGAVMNTIRKDARLLTDESYLYRKVGKWFEGGHESVKHSIREFARGSVETPLPERVPVPLQHAQDGRRRACDYCDPEGVWAAADRGGIEDACVNATS